MKVKYGSRVTTIRGDSNRIANLLQDALIGAGHLNAGSEGVHQATTYRRYKEYAALLSQVAAAELDEIHKKQEKGW